MIPGAVPGIVVGIVTDNRDPEGMGRVKLRFPWLDDAMETDWVPVAQPHAGPDRGIYWMPEKDDEMIVGFLHGDMNRPVVLGAMWNHVDPPPSQDPRERMLRSKNGHTIRFLDSTVTAGDKGALIVEDGHGSRIAMTNGYMLVSAKGTLVIEAVGAVMIRGNGWQRIVTPNSNPI